MDQVHEVGVLVFENVKMLDVAEKASLEAEGQTFAPADGANS